MPSPSVNISNLRPDLGALTEFDLAGNQGQFIGLDVLPPVNVELTASTFGRVPREALLQNPDTKRAADGSYNSLDWNFKEDSYSTEERGLEGRVDDRNAKVYSGILNQEAITANIVAHSVLTAAEKQIADLVFNTTTWTGATLYKDVSLGWHDANSDPLADVEFAVRQIYTNSGIWANALVINRKSFRDLRRHPDVIDAIRSSGAGNPTKAAEVTVQMIAAVFDLPKIIVAGGTRNSAGKGLTAVPDQIWGSFSDSQSKAMVARIAEPNDPPEYPCLGRTFHWSADGSQIGGAVESYYCEKRRGTIVRVRQDVQYKIYDPLFGFLLDTI